MTIENTLPVNNDAAITGKFVLIIIFLTVATPMVAAYWIFHSGHGIPTSTINEGKLLTPATPLVSPSFYDADHQPINWSNDNAWRVITVSQNQCDKICQDNHYTARQVHIRLAKEAHRIERWLVVVGETNALPSLPESITSDSGLTVAAISQKDWQALFANSSLTPEHHIVLVDQDGYAMMTYDENNTGSHLLDDLTRLLKFSYE